MTNIFMGISVIVIVSVLILLAMGYSFNKDGSIEQSGLIRVNSNPRGALVEIDGEAQFGKTEMSKMLSAGEHMITVSKPGYDIWRRTLNVEAGLLTRLDWARLFPLEKIVETVHEYDSLRLMSVSPDNQYLLFLPEGNEKIQMINIKDDDVKYNFVDLGVALGLTDSEVPGGSLEIAQWSRNSEKILLKWTLGETTSWVLVDVKNALNSVDLSEKFGLGFSKILMAGGNGDKLWAVENGNLRLINISNLTISGVLINGLEAVANDGGTVAYARTNEAGERLVGIYREGERGGATVQKLSSDIKEVRVAVGAYWGDDWIAFSLDDRMSVRLGSFPSFERATSSLETIAEHDIGFIPEFISVSPGKRFAMAINGNQVVAMDAELREHWTYVVDGEWDRVDWLDDFLTWEILENKLVVRDFDGNNRREISEVAGGTRVALTENGRWLYFVAPIGEDGKYILQRGRL